MSPRSIFISYAHEDSAFKDDLVAHLRALQHHLDDVTVWTDDEIEVGEDYRAAIEAALSKSSVTILLVSVDSLISDFIQSNEVPPILERRRVEGMLFMPVLVRHCAWRQIPWLERLQIENTVPIVDLTQPGEKDQRYTEIAERVLSHLTASDNAATEPSTQVVDAQPNTTAEANPFHVNREDELAIFKSLFEPSTDAHVMVVDGETSMGKTWFLQKCATARPPGTPMAWIDFKEPGLAVLDVITLLSLRLSTARFPNTIERLAAASLNPGAASLTAEDLLTGKLLTEARISRRAGSPDVIFVDSLEFAASAVRQWVSRSLVGSAIPDPELVLVIAGHDVADVWQPHPVGVVHTELRPLSVDDAVHLADIMGLDLKLDEVRRYHQFADGNPLVLAAGFDNLKRKATAHTVGKAPS